MKLQQLTTFFWTANLGSFSAAAEHLHATQSTVSMRVRELERSLGVELFDRSHRKIKLTAEGRVLFDYTGRLLGLVAEIEHHFSASGCFSGYVRIGVAEVVSITWLPRYIDLIAKRYPAVRLELDEGLTGELMQSLADGSLDLVLVPGRNPTRGVLSRSLGHMPFAWMASPSLGLAEQVHSPSTLSQWPIIGLKSSSYHTAVVEGWFRHNHVACTYLARCKSMTVAASMAIQGLGVTYLPIRCYQEQLRSGVLQIVKTDGAFLPVEFIAATSIDETNPLPRALAELAGEVSDFDTTEPSVEVQGWAGLA